MVKIIKCFSRFKTNKNTNNPRFKVHLQEGLKNKINFTPQHYFKLNFGEAPKPTTQLSLELDLDLIFKD